MGLFDLVSRVLGVEEAAPPPARTGSAAAPSTPSQAVAVVKWRSAYASRDVTLCLPAALGLLQAQRFDECLQAFEQMGVLFPERRAEWLRWMGQTCYVGLSFHATDPAQRLAAYQQALTCYFEAAALGERSQELNVIELCELLSREPVLIDEKRAAVQRYLALFPGGQFIDRAHELLKRLDA